MKQSASALIAAAKRDAPRPSLENEVLGALGAATLATALAPSSSFGANLWLALKHAAVSKVGIATIAFAAATGGYTAGRLQERAIAQAAPETFTQTPTRTLTPTLAPPATPAPTLTRALAPTPGLPAPAITNPIITTPEPTATVIPPPPPHPTLGEELTAIKRARSAVLSKDAAGATAALDDYDRAHPSGALAEESLALRVRAAKLAGDDVAAAEALTKLETRFPESIQLSALRR